jgi:hypothetical protein
MLMQARKAWRLLHREGWGALIERLAQRLGSQPQFLSMLTPEEMEWTEEYARARYSGKGHMVDLGCWLGSSTIALARGLQNNTHPRARRRVVKAYDRFVWEAWMEPIVAGTRLAGSYRPGDLFLDEFVRQVRPWQHLIQVHPGDLLRLEWIGEPIEFLFIDVMKSWELANKAIREFFRHLIPGKAVIQHQDFVHYYCSWIHLLAWHFRDYFQPVCHVEKSPSVVFRYVKPIPAELLAVEYSFGSFSAGEFEAAFDYALSLVSPECHGEIRLARIMAFIHMGDLARALEEIAEAKDRGELAGATGLASVEGELIRRHKPVRAG